MRALSTLLVTVLFSAICVPALAQWADDGIPIAFQSGSQAQSELVLAADSGGGYFVGYIQGNSLKEAWVQKVDVHGNLLWGGKGVRVASEAGESNLGRIQVVPDLQGGVYVAVTSSRFIGEPSVGRLARLDGNGTVLWGETTSGVIVIASRTGDHVISVKRGPVCEKRTAEGVVLWSSPPLGANVDPLAVVDGIGGAIVASLTDGVYLSRVTPQGVGVWSVNTGDPRTTFRIVSDGGTGAVYTSGSTKIQRVDSAGTFVWGSGIPFTDSPGPIEDHRLVLDQATGDFIVAFTDRASGLGRAYVQRIDSTGVRLWGDRGVAASTWLTDQVMGDVVQAPDGVIAVWAQGVGNTSDYDVYAQRIDSGGVAAWGPRGLSLCDDSNRQRTPVVSSSSDGVVWAWLDLRGTVARVYGQGLYDDYFAMHGLGAPRIDLTEDVPFDQGGAVSVRWEASPFDVASQRTVSHYSVWRAIELPLPQSAISSPRTIAADNDVPAMVYEDGFYWEWLTNRQAAEMAGYAYAAETLYDSTSADNAIHHFMVIAHSTDEFVYWKSAPDSGYSIDNLPPRAPAGFAAARTHDYDVELHWHPNTESDLAEYRIYRGEGPDFLPSEATLVAVSVDTVVTDFPYDITEPWHLKLSAVDIHENESGFALLRPSPPVSTQFAAHSALWDGTHVELYWEVTSEANPEDFAVTRRAAGSGGYLPRDLSVERSGTGFFAHDDAVQSGETYYYQILVDDDQGATAFVELSVQVPAAELRLAPNFPNPFNPTTTITFSTEKQGPVRLAIFDARGILVSTLIDRPLPAGQRSMDWDGTDNSGKPVGSGVYFCRLTTVTGELSQKMVLVK